MIGYKRQTDDISYAKRLMSTEVKSMVAKLLAKEDVIVQRGDFQTASFDLKNRVLKLPLWKTVTNDELDLFIGHEVSHALHTPTDAIDKFVARFKGVPFSLCNVVEDVRIERIIQQEYPGLIKSFTSAYKSLYEKDFFQLKETPVSERGFVDRLNLTAKLGKNVDIEFTAEEQELVDATFATKTFEDVLDVCERIKDFVDENEPEPEDKSETPSNNQANSDLSEDQNAADGYSDFQSSEDEEESNENKNETDDAGEGDKDKDDGLDEAIKGVLASLNAPRYNAKSQDDFDETLSKDIIQCSNDYGDVVVNFIEPTKERIEFVVKSYDQVAKSRKEAEANASSYSFARPLMLENFEEFKATNKKYISALKREFDMKKAAYQYSRATVSKTGKLDVNKLYSYKYSEDIFNSVTNLADAKNHGMLFMIDLSGSMADQIGTIYKQAINLGLFCKSVGIPFEIYGFTASDFVDRDEYKNRFTACRGMIDLSQVKIIELLNSSLPNKKFKEAVQEMYIAAEKYERYECVSRLEQMAGTPLSQTIVCMHHIAKKFIAKHKPQHLTTMFLTDGDGHSLSFEGDCYVARGAEAIGKIHGNTVTFSDSTQDRYINQTLLENYKKVTNSRLIHFFLVNFKNELLRHYYIPQTAKAQWRSFTRDKLITLDGVKGYDRVFITKDNKRDLDTDKDFKDANTEGLTDTALKNAFIKHNKNKKGQRVFVNKFVEIVA